MLCSWGVKADMTHSICAWMHIRVAGGPCVIPHYHVPIPERLKGEKQTCSYLVAFSQTSDGRDMLHTATLEMA